MTSLGALVLCGGHSRRMGQSKAWLPCGAETMLQRIVRILGTVVPRVVVVAADGQGLPALPGGVAVVRDELPDVGPLGGISTGLKQFEATSTVFVTACDVPFLVPEFASYLLQRLHDDPSIDLAIPEVEGKLHPLSAAYRTSVGVVAKAMLDRGERRARDIVLHVPHVRISGDELATVDPTLASLWNVNTPEEYAESFKTRQ